MATYRLYCIDGDGRIAKGEWLEADTDEVAIEKAKALRHPLPWELWLEQRQVAKVRAQKPEPPPVSSTKGKPAPTYARRANRFSP